MFIDRQGLHGPFGAMIAATDIAAQAATADEPTTGNVPETATRAPSIGKAVAVIDRLLVRGKFALSRTAMAG